jgi:hypothetical protein
MKRVRGSSFGWLVHRVALGSLATVLIATRLSFGSFALAATFNVNCGTGGNLQNKINAAPSGSTILIKGTCRGNFAFLGKTLTLEGNPTATLDGMETGITLFDPSSSSFALHLIKLTITGGGSAFNGAGVFSHPPTTLNKVTVTGNEASGPSVATGGGVFAAGNLSVVSSTITNNRATVSGTNSGSTVSATGGGLEVGGNLTLTNSVVSGNVVSARNSLSGTPLALGGGIAVGGKLTLSHTRLSGNRVGASGDGGNAQGAAVYAAGSTSASLTNAVVSGNTAAAVSFTSHGAGAGPTIYIIPALSVSRSTIKGNTLSAQAGPGSGAIVEAAGAFSAASLTVTHSSVRNNSATASGGTAEVEGTALLANTAMHIARSTISRNAGTATSSAGTAAGFGGINASTFTLSRSTVDRNTLTVIASGGNAVNLGAGIYTSDLISTTSTISRNAGIAKTTAAAPATVQGPGIDALHATIKNSTIVLNHARAVSSPSGTANALGGGVLLGSTSLLVDDTVAGNTASGNGGTVSARGGGLYGPSTTLESTIIGSNTALLGPDCYGGPTSAGHNLIGKTAGCSFTKKATDKVNKNPRLDPLGNYGGPTQTMELKPTSPARDAVPTAVCPLHVDQRGVHRPQGSRCDIGAFELKKSEA